ncbi:hypothetical protein AWB79_07501 [Caballeronia hypogeia]|uniref:Uncharacterized protein n=1 Tax=Caballeronia hypogeia TaxID=1777140 RepID=A0A158DTB7_9BURK|nr:hypothetical protein [Caballeronia hypogeia]SAK97680.1 hypothetical protein AWB79_07501 [Caballeronia hypogeia]
MHSYLSASEIKQFIEQRFPRLVPKVNGKSDSYYLDHVREKRDSTRILRVKRRSCEIKLVVSTPKGGRLARQGEVISNTDTLASIIADEIALFESGRAIASPLAAINSPKAAVCSPRPSSDQRAVALVSGDTAFQFDRDENGVDPFLRLLYYWEIRNASGEIAGRYVGKAADGSRPWRRYPRRVENLLRGDSYGRSIHHALAESVLQRHRAKVTFLCNVPSDADIDTWEKHAIAVLDCYGNRPDQRNRTAGRQLSEKIVPQALVQALTALRA